MDSRLRLPLKAKLFSGTKKENIIIVTTRKAPERKKKIFEEQGVRVLVAPLDQGHVDLKWMRNALRGLGIRTLLLEGGPILLGAALKAGIIDHLHCYLAPKILGDKNARDAIEGFSLLKLHQAIQLKNLTVQKINKDLFIQADVHRTR